MTRKIDIAVKNLVAWQTNVMSYICGNSDYVVGFVFDDEWNEYETKTARFIHNGAYTDIVFTGTECSVPVILDAKKIEIGVYAGDLHTTTPAVVHCRKSILCKGGVPADPEPDVYAQLMEKLNSMDGSDPDAVAKAVEDYLAANPPAKGEDGDDYVLTETDKTEIAEMAAELVDVPESSGGGEKKWKLLIDTTIAKEDAVITLYVDRDSDGNPFACEEVTICWVGIAVTDEAASGKAWISINAQTAGYNAGKMGFVTDDYFYYTSVTNYSRSQLIRVAPNVFLVNRSNGSGVSSPCTETEIRSIELSGYQQKAFYGRVVIYGR